LTQIAFAVAVFAVATAVFTGVEQDIIYFKMKLAVATVATANTCSYLEYKGLFCSRL